MTSTDSGATHEPRNVGARRPPATDGTGPAPITVHLVAAARPNFMKVAPLYHALRAEPWCRPVLVHTGQHYDADMSQAFLTDLRLPDPDIALGVGSGTHAQQTAAVMVAYERACFQDRPDWIVVVGDVNSTMAAALVAAKLRIPLAHLEAGLRSGDRDMPEEINRVVTDAVADLLWTPSPDADENLLREGRPRERIVQVGNIIIDSYEMLRSRIEADPVAASLGLAPREYGIVTLHRPSNVDDPRRLAAWLDEIRRAAPSVPLVFPVHPRTKGALERADLAGHLRADDGWIVTPPLGYVRFLALVRQARFVITDSGGVQEETTYLGIPCLTLRTTTERPITITDGTNRLVQPGGLARAIDDVLASRGAKSRRPDLWDGRTAHRVVQSLRSAIHVATTTVPTPPHA